MSIWLFLFIYILFVSSECPKIFHVRNLYVKDAVFEWLDSTFLSLVICNLCEFPHATQALLFYLAAFSSKNKSVFGDPMWCGASVKRP